MSEHDVTGTRYPPAQPHGALEELFEDVFRVHGSMRMAPGMRIDRNMLVLRQDGELTVIGPVRLDASGEAALDALGRVRHVLRLGNFHGVDDAYYVDHYGAEFWCQPNSLAYPEPLPSQLMTEQSMLPVDGAELFLFRDTRHPEGAVLLPRHGLLITCDALQHWSDREGCSLLARLVMPVLGFRRGSIVGPPWRKRMTPPGGSLQADFERLLNLEFAHQIGAHGGLCRGNARELARAAVARAFS